MESPAVVIEQPSSRRHDPSPWIPFHPERPQRIAAIERLLERRGWLGCRRLTGRRADPELLELVHDRSLVELVRRTAAAGGGVLDPDTAVGPASFAAALDAAGAAVELVEQLAAGRFSRGFALVRPPGHHAERARAMGFCLFNNVAVAAAHARARLAVERVAIVDWDVHHGNGTAEIFSERDDVLYLSIHRYPFYPGTGRPDEVGLGCGRGFTINLPAPAESDGGLWLALCQRLAAPILRAFGPQLILVSAGYDAHAADPLGGCRLTSADFRELARLFASVARELGVPIGAVLEGGYEPEALAESVAETLAGLSDGVEPKPVPEHPLVGRLAPQFAPFWDCLA